MHASLASGYYYGDKVREGTIAGITLSEYVYAPEQSLSCHTHEHAYLCFVLQGSYTENHRNRTSECVPNSLILHPEGERHSDQFHNRGGHVFNVNLGQEWIPRLGSLPSLLDQRIEITGGLSSTLMQKLYQEFCHRDAASPLAMEGLTLEILAMLARQPMPPSNSKPPYWLTQVRDRLHEQYLDAWTLSGIAEDFGVHPTHLARLFRRHYHCSVGEYVRQLRIQLACKKVQDTEIPLAEIAHQTGFADQSHFSRLFKQHYGISPAAYRKTKINTANKP